MVNKILIRKSDRKTLHKDRRTLGMNGENLQEVLLFCLDEKIEGTGIVEVELPNGEKGMIQVERTEEGYELPIKSSLMAQTGFVKFQLRILHNEVEIFKSEIIALEVKDSINATATIPEEYPSWVDTLTNLKKDLEKAESERVSNENERISAEKTRQENFTKMQKTVENATSNIKDLKEDYNENAKQKTEEFNKNFEEKQKAINDNAEAKTTAFGENAEAQTKTFNTNSDDKLAEYNRNHTAKMKEFDDNYDTKTKTFDDNAAAKLDKYNKNTELKEKSFNDNAGTKTETFNSNAADKQNEFDENASDKLAEYNQNAKELINKVEQVQVENEALKAENKLIKEQMPSSSVSGNSVHIEDSGTLDFDWKIRGGHAQTITTQPENYIDDREARGKTILEATALYLPIMNLKAGNGYYFKIFDNNNKIQNDSRYVAAEFYNENKVKIGSGPLGFPYNFTEEVATKVKYAKIYYNGNDTDKVIGNTAIKKIGLKITSSVSADDIDMFVPDSPSPDYPSEVETVGSIVNELKLKNGKSIKTYGLDVSIDNGIITINGTANEYYPTFLISGDGEIETRPGRPSINANPNWYNSITLTERDYTLKFEYISGDGGTAHRPYVFIHTSDGKNTEFSQGNSTRIKNYTGEIDGISFYVDKNQTFNNYKFRVYVVKGTYTKDTIPPYSSFGMGSVEIDVVNKNFLVLDNVDEQTVNEMKYSCQNGEIEVQGTATATLDLFFPCKIVGYNNICTLNASADGELDKNACAIRMLKEGKNVTNANSFGNVYRTLKKPQIVPITADMKREKYQYICIRINEGTTANFKLKVWLNCGTDVTDYTRSQSQTAIMPIQQEMLTGDCISSVEHHEWGKLVLTGKENWNMLYGAGMFHVTNLVRVKDINSRTSISNYFKYNNANNGIYTNLEDGELAVQYYEGNTTLYIKYLNISTVEDFKTWLKTKHNEGNSVIIYYKQATPVDLELTEEQKAIREQKLYTYKNITNIAVSDELASIDVNYKKDPTTEHDELQNQIDEIKQLISTTETSALLLDNLQKDVESEVE